MTSAEQVVNEFRRTPRVAGHSVQTRQALREALRTVDLLDSLPGLSVKELDDDEALLLGSDGREITTWQQGYPYTERMSREEYERTKRPLQIELLKMQSWVKDSGRVHSQIPLSPNGLSHGPCLRYGCLSLFPSPLQAR